MIKVKRTLAINIHEFMAEHDIPGALFVDVETFDNLFIGNRVVVVCPIRENPLKIYDNLLIAPSKIVDGEAEPLNMGSVFQILDILSHDHTNHIEGLESGHIVVTVKHLSTVKQFIKNRKDTLQLITTK